MLLSLLHKQFSKSCTVKSANATAQSLWRAFHATSRAYAGVEKSALSALRKKTGYTFANCKKALELHNNDINLAEKWLNEQAQSMGWSKATKLADRATTQGLVGVLVRGNIGAMIEVYCETDFVARNEHFRSFVDHVARICAQYTECTRFDGDLWKIGFEVEALCNLRTINGKNLGDDLALLIGSVGENVAIGRSVCFKTNNDLKLAGYAHPAPAGTTSSTENITQLGKYGTIVAFRSTADDAKIDVELQKNLCQHIVGMNPLRIGDYDHDEALPNKDEEKCLIHQEYLLDETKTVGEVLTENNVKVIDYVRYECGERQSNLKQAKLQN